MDGILPWGWLKLPKELLWRDKTKEWGVMVHGKQTVLVRSTSSFQGQWQIAYSQSLVVKGLKSHLKEFELEETIVLDLGEI